jgi:hypothetical protein
MDHHVSIRLTRAKVVFLAPGGRDFGPAMLAPGVSMLTPAVVVLALRRRVS